MADNVEYTAAADATPPGGTKAATDELSDGSHAGIAKIAVSADGDRTLIPATAVDGLLVEVSNPTAGDGLTDAELRATPVPVSGTVSVTEPVSVDDNGGSLTVDGTVAVGPTVTPGTAATNLGKAEDDPHVSGDVGVMALGVRNDASTPIAADGDYIPLAVGPQGGLYVQGLGNLSGLALEEGGVLEAINVAVQSATPAGNNNIGDVDIASLPNEGQQTMANSISVAIASDQSAVPVSGTVTANVPEPLDTQIQTLNGDGDPQAVGYLGGGGIAIPVVSPDGTQLRASVEGIAAQDAAVSGDPVAIGGRASTAAPTAVSADGDAAWIRTDRRGNVGVQMADQNGSLMNLIATVDQGLPVEPVGGGAFPIKDGGGSITVDGTVVVGPTVTPGTAATNLGKAEDDPHVSGDVGVQALAVRHDADTGFAADGDYVPLQVDFASLKTKARLQVLNGAGTSWTDVGASGGGVSVPIDDHGGSLTVDMQTAATATTSSVSDSASNATLLASNAARKGATITNDSSAALYVKLGTTATLTDYTVRLLQFAYYEVPYSYTGRIDGIWATDPNDGAARMTELT